MSRVLFATVIAIAVMAVSCGDEELPSQLSGSDYHPKIFVHGWGPRWVSGLDAHMDRFADAGVPAEDLHKVDYRYVGTYDEMTADVAEGIRKVLARYPEGTQVDVMGYSLGTGVSIHAILKHGLHRQVRKYISLAGVDFGQHERPPFCKLEFMCSDVFKVFTPYRNPRLMEFYGRYQAELAGIDKCAVYSPEDGNLDPVEAGVFPDGMDVSVSDVSHIALGRSPKAFAAFRDQCYRGTID